MLLLHVYPLRRRSGRTVTTKRGLWMKYPARGKRWVRHGVEHKGMVKRVS